MSAGVITGTIDEVNDVDRLTDALYTVPPEEFVAARAAVVAEARSHGSRDVARAVGALGKPTAAAWLLNQLVRRRASEVTQLVELGDRLRAAQRNLAGAELRTLTSQRHAVVAAFAQQAAALAVELGRPLSAGVAQQVEETLRSAVSDADAGHALLAGRLTTALSYVGMGPVDENAVVLPFERPGATRARPVGEPQVGSALEAAGAAVDNGTETAAAARAADLLRRRAVARQGLADAEERVAGAADELDRHTRLAENLEAAAAEFATRVEAARATLTDLTDRFAGTDAARQDATVARDRAAQEATEAGRVLQRARAALDEIGP